MTDNPDCEGRADFYQVYNDDGPHCFANEGELEVHITGVTSVAPGRNQGQVQTEDGWWSPLRGPWGGPYDFNFPVTVKKVKIL